MNALANHFCALKLVAASLLCVSACGSSLAGEPLAFPETHYTEASSIELANWATPAGDVLYMASQMPPVPVEVLPDGAVAVPLLDNTDVREEMILADELPGDCPPGSEGRRGVRPYGGGHPWDWWGCGASPYRTGPGMCDNYRVGPIWNVTVDGMVMSREDANLEAITARPFATGIYDPPPNPPYLTEQFNYASGGRVVIVGKDPDWANWQGYAAYEGIEAWEAAVIYPKLSPIPTDDDPYPPNSFEQRSIHYRANLHSGEINFLRCKNSPFRPFCGVRYIKFDDEIRDQIDREVPPPLPSPGPTIVTFTDQLNLYDLENNLMGFQIGVRHDLWQINSRFSIEGFLNGGVYYNKVKYTNVMGSLTTQYTSAGSQSVSGAFNNDMSDLSEIAYTYEASLSGVCRLNKCWALRGGYQVMWINGLNLAQDAYLGDEIQSRSLLFQGWHAGIECRR